MCPSKDGTTISTWMSEPFEGLAAGCKENHFYSLAFGQAEANIY